MSDVIETQSVGEVNETKLLEAYIQKPEKVAFYQRGLAKMQQAGVFVFQWHWSWWAFFFGWAFLLYRKAYLPALVAFLVTFFVGLFPLGFLISMVVMGGISSYFVLKRYHQLKSELQGTEQQQIDAMRTFGGYHSWVVVLVVVIYSFIALSTLIMALAMI